MRQKLLPAFLILIAVSFCGCVRPKATGSPEGIKLGQIFDAGQFRMRLAPGMQRVEVHGIDSKVGEFKSSDIVLGFDYGMYSNNFGDWPSNTVFEEVIVD